MESYKFICRSLRFSLLVSIRTILGVSITKLFYVHRLSLYFDCQTILLYFFLVKGLFP